MSTYTIAIGHARMDLRAVHAFLTTTYWSPGVTLERVERAARGSLCAGVFHGADQVAYARAITDGATFAYLADVYVLAEHRGQGLSTRLLDALFAQPELQDLRRMMLVTRDAHGLYQRYGFKPLGQPDRVMERHRPAAGGAAEASLPVTPAPGTTGSSGGD